MGSSFPHGNVTKRVVDDADPYVVRRFKSDSRELMSPHRHDEPIRRIYPTRILGYFEETSVWYPVEKEPCLAKREDSTILSPKDIRLLLIKAVNQIDYVHNVIFSA